MASMVEETETETQPMKLDFRFADEMDSMDIVNFVNLEYAVEHTGPYSFRREGPVVGVEEVEGDLTSMPVKWLVLETPQPEEKIVGCARLRYEGGDGRVDVLCADSAGTGVVYRNVLRRMLSKVETVAYNIGLRSVVVEAAEWRVDLEALLTQCNYQERSGHQYPPENLTKPTMVLEFHKVFGEQGTHARSLVLPEPGEEAPLTASTATATSAHYVTSTLSTATPALLAELEGMMGGGSIDMGGGMGADMGVEMDIGAMLGAGAVGADMDMVGGALQDLAALRLEAAEAAAGAVQGGQGGLEGGQGGQMPQLIESLFAALHSEYGQGQNAQDWVTPGTGTAGTDSGSGNANKP